jgi:hypothetical protein
MSRKASKNNYKRAAVELWKTQVTLSIIRNQLKMIRKTLRRVLTFIKANTLNHIKPRKPMSRRLRKISTPTRIQEVILFGRGNDQILVLSCPPGMPTKI